MVSAVVVNASTRDRRWLVMVHGMTQDHRIFSAQVDAFRSDYRILLVDLPGHGLSSAIGGPYGHVEIAGHVESALAANDATAVHYWGTHTGATVGLYLAATVPGLIASLVLEAPLIPGANPPVVVETIEKAKKTSRDRGVAAAVEEWWQESCWYAFMRAHPATSRAAEQRAIVDDFGGGPWLDPSTPASIADIEARLSGIAVPALIYNGVEDHADFFSAADQIDGLLSNSRKETIPNTGGFPAWEDPNAVNGIVADFLSDIATAERSQPPIS